MKTSVAHLQINVSARNMPFYRELATFLGLESIYADETIHGVGAANTSSLWFMAGARDVANDYDGPGVNHIGLGAASIADVDRVAGFLTEKGIAHLFETPRHRPEFAHGPEHTYYQVMFESPDRILFEVVYTGPK